MSAIFDEHLLANGPWREFERNTARLLLHQGWKDPRVVGRSGDHGADVLAVNQSGELWVFQCKFSRGTNPGKSAIDDVRRAGEVYGADALVVVSSLTPTRGFWAEFNRLIKMGLKLYHLGPNELSRGSMDAPFYPPSRFDLHEYQIEAVERVRVAILETERAQLVLATGLGKTVVMAEVVADMLADELLGEGRVLVLAHTLDLVDQLLRNFWRHLPKTVATHRYAEGERPLSFDGLTFATVQSFSKVDDPPFFDLVIVDEAHHIGSPEYQRTLSNLKSPRLIGVTATPWRSDGVSISHFLGEPVMTMGIKEGLAQGFLADVDYRVFIDGIDWDFVREQSSYSYTIAQLNKKLLIPTRDEEAIREIRKVFDSTQRRRGLAFSPSQTHAKSFASDLRRHGFRASALTSENTATERFKILSRFAAGHLDFLCAVDIFNEGIDVPDVDLLVFLRVTHSRRIFVQQLGRGLRLNSNKKDVVVLDFAADVRRVHAALDLTTPLEDEVIERLRLGHTQVSFQDKSLGGFFYEWIADMGDIQDYEEDEVIRLPILDSTRFNYPDPQEG